MKLRAKPQAGFTLIELLIIVSILVTLLSLASASFSTMERTDKLNATVTEIISTLSLAQSQTMNGFSLEGETPLQFGVYFEADKFTLFPEDIVTDLSQGIKITTINLPQEKIIFSRVTGQVDSFDPQKNFLILQEERTNLEKKIIINKLGIINIE